jgi:hypothetical protein
MGGLLTYYYFFQVYNSWKETDFSTQWCYENYIQVIMCPLFNSLGVNFLT